MQARAVQHRSPGARILLWLFVFAYVPFVIANGFDAWRQPAFDFPPLYSATKVVFDQHSSPYGENAFAAQSAALGRWVPPFIYPPPSLLAIYPLHFFSYDGAKALMLVANHACLLFATLFLFRKLFRDEFASAPHQLTAAVVLIYLLLFDPLAVTLHLGQVNLLLLVFLCLAWHALKRNAGALAIAVPLSLAILIKTYPVLLLPLLVLRRRYKASALTVGLVGFYCALSYLLLPAEIWPDWIQKVLPSGGDAHPGPWNQNIRAFVARAFMPNGFSEPLYASAALVKPAIALLSLVVVCLTLWAAFRARRRPDTPRTIDTQMSLFLFMIFLIAPVSWEHHFVYLLPSLVVVLLMLFSDEVRGHWRWIAPISLCLIAWKLPIFGENLKRGPQVLLISAKFYPAVALWLFFLLEVLRSPRAELTKAPVSQGADAEAQLALAKS